MGWIIYEQQEVIAHNSKGWPPILFFHDSPLLFKTKSKHIQAGAGELVTWLRALAAVAEDLSLVPSPCMVV